MKLFDLERRARTQGGEYVLGEKDLHSTACYLVFGILQGGEGDRLVKAGKGYEEILCAVGGPLVMHTTSGKITLPRGHAVHVKEDDSFVISNPSGDPVIYVTAGGAVVQ
ncbi:MAG: hypothetical protein HY913_06295 [Desulfomonile tiedjei]|nr:hypothetical protein [Desulfomonile tiedjei]